MAYMIRALGKRFTACWRRKSLYEGSSMVCPGRPSFQGV
jgi:hypothetical protein